MPLTRDDDGWLWDDEALSEEAVIERRDQQIEDWADELGLIAAEELRITVMQAIEFPSALIDNFAVRFLRRVGEMVTSAFVFANGGADKVTDSGWRVAATLVERQVEYGRGFVASLRQGALSEAQAIARSRLYAGASTAAFERGRAAQFGFDPPAWPTEGCEGMVNCRCYWSIDEKPDRIEGTWIAVGDKETCGWCADNAVQYAPYVQMK